MNNRLQIGQKVKINTFTNPSRKTSDYFMTVTVKKIFDSGRFLSEESEPFFGYNIWDKADIVE